MAKVESVRRVPVLAMLTEEELAQVHEASERKTFDDGEMIVAEHTRGEGLYLLDKGAARVLKARGHKHNVIARLHEGDHFGEMSLITDAATSASIQAEGQVSCLFIPKERFVNLIEEHPELGRKVLWTFAQTLSKRLVDTDKLYCRALVRKNRSAAIKHLFSLFWLQFRVFFSYLWVWLRRKVRLGHKPEKLSRIHRRNARHFKETAFKLKGANVKIGQLASLQVHLLPKEYIEEFRSMRDQVPPTEYPLIAAMIQQEFGLSPLEVFAQFDKVPIAAASMGQVHVAELNSGEKVVVKVLHPGLEQSVAVDLWLMRKLIRALSLFVRRVDLMALYKEAEEPLRNELDLLREARSTEKIARELEPLGIKVPKIYWRYSTRRILTLEFIDGTNVDDLAKLNEWNVDREKLIQSYVQAFLHQAFAGGFFHCDPHPGNAFSTPQGQLALLDFGMVKRLPDVVRVGLLKEMLGGFFNNPTMYADGVIERGVVDEREREQVESFAREILSDPEVRRALFDHDIRKDGDMKRLFGKVGDLIKELETFRTPQDELMFLRALGIVIDVCRQVVPEVAVSKLVMPVMMPVMTQFMAKHPEYAQVSSQEKVKSEGS